MEGLPNRQTIRMAGYDYASAGAYFVTICVQNQWPILGKVEAGGAVLSPCGEIAKSCWVDLPNHYHNVQLDEWVIMPNHIHGIIVLDGKQENTLSHGLPEVIRAFKSFSAKRINRYLSRSGALWQRNYYERIIRDAAEHRRIRTYIAENPSKWLSDELYIDVEA